MENFWILYWITRFDAIISMFVTLASFSGILAVVSGMVMGFNLDEHGNKDIAKTSKKWLIIFSVLTITLFCTKALIPSKEDAMLIAAGVGVTEAVKSETAQRLASKSVSVVEKWLDEQTKEEEKK